MAFLTNASSLARALQVVAARKQGKAGGTLVKNLLEKDKLRKGSFDSLFPSTITIDGRDIEDLIQKSLNSGSITNAEAIIIKQTYRETVEYYAVKAVPLTKAKTVEIISAIDEFVSYFNTKLADPATQVSDSLYTELQNKVDRITKNIIGQKTLYRVFYQQGLPGEVGSIVLASSGYSTGTSLINKTLKEILSTKVKEYKGSAENVKNLENAEVLTKTLQNWGHALTDVETVDEDGVITVEKKVLTGKLVATLLSIGQAGISETEAQIISTNFAQTTGQISSSIDLINTGNSGQQDPGVLSLVFSSGYFQGVRVQFGAENQAQGSLERNWSLEQVLSNNEDLRKKLNTALDLPENASFIQTVSRLIRISSSPTYIDKVVYSAVSPLIFDKTKGIKFAPKTVPLLKSKRNVSQIFGKAKSGTTKTPSTTRSKGLEFKNITTKGLTDLSMLMMQINSSLHDQIKRNMGTGNRKDVLNYRTGRFAQSAKVERISESRQGMITAFYSYMKNPYATFSRGGRQERPYTRDPKTLISKSIRELAGQQVANRMRAVLV